MKAIFNEEINMNSHLSFAILQMKLLQFKRKQVVLLTINRLFRMSNQIDLKLKPGDSNYYSC